MIRKIRKFALWFSLILSVIIVVAVLGIKLWLGGGNPYLDVSTEPLVSTERITKAIELPYPPGMVISSSDGRIFYTYHMLHKPERFTNATVFEWKNGKGIPFPNVEIQKEFQGAMGIYVDRQERFWIVIPGELNGERTRLMAFDVNSRQLVLDHYFAKGVASGAQDMRITNDGNTVFLADPGMLKFRDPSLIVFDITTKKTRTVLKGHPSVSAQNWTVRKPNGEPYKLFYNLISFAAGVDGIALSKDGQWLYYAAISNESLYRVPTTALLDTTLTKDNLASNVELVGKKPLNDGIEILPNKSLFITDIENGGLALLSQNGKLTTYAKIPEVEWADCVTVAPDGKIWFTDSQLTKLIDQFGNPPSEEELKQNGPYPIYRIDP